MNDCTNLKDDNQRLALENSLKDKEILILTEKLKECAYYKELCNLKFNSVKKGLVGIRGITPLK